MKTTPNAQVEKDGKFATLTLNGHLIWRFDAADENQALLMADNINRALRPKTSHEIFYREDDGQTGEVDRSHRMIVGK